MDFKDADLEDVLSMLDTSLKGLQDKEVSKRLETFGYNELTEKTKVTPLKVFAGQFSNFIVWLLIVAALISLYIDEVVNFWVISSIVLFVVILGFFQEYRAERSMEALKKLSRPQSRVLRDGRIMDVPTKNIVRGDVLVLEMGDSVPADAYIFELTGLKVDESALTGESMPVEKADHELIYAGTQIVHGKCRALVTAVGMQTRLGSIAGLIQDEDVLTPLQKKIMSLSKSLAFIALLAATVAFILGMLSGAPLEEMLLITLALAVAAVPVGLPLTLTITLAHGMRHMAKHKAIVRKMLGVETLGSTTVICTDKTGTLTKNEMTIERIFTAGQLFEVSGSGYEPRGRISLSSNIPGKDSNDNSDLTSNLSADVHSDIRSDIRSDIHSDIRSDIRSDIHSDIRSYYPLSLLLKAGSLCNNASLEQFQGYWRSVGDPTEVSLIVAAGKAGIWKDDLDPEYEKVHEILFTSERKLMTTIHQTGKGRIAFSKGAPEVVLRKCTYIERNDGISDLDEDHIPDILDQNTEFARSAYRVLGLAYREIPDHLPVEEAESEMVFLGLVAIIDPEREEAKQSIGLCTQAGIKVVMITGDNEDTAKAIGKKLGIWAQYRGKSEGMDRKLQEIIKDGAITGEEMQALNDSEFDNVVEGISIYARVMPEQKLRIVKALQKKGHVVAMTGDGVNDAPALKKADIGISMGLKGTDVARESSLMVLQDDNFKTIVEAVKSGRSIYENIEKFTCYLISRNFTEIILIMLGVTLLGFDFIPLLALQILFINMFDEVMPSIGLSLDPIREEVMYSKPRNPAEKILNRRNLLLVISVALVMGMTCFLVFLVSEPLEFIEKARTMTFAAVVSMILFVPFAFRSLESSVLSTGLNNRIMLWGVFATFLITLMVMYLPFFNELFGLVPLSLSDWGLPLAAAFSTFMFVEVIKKIANYKKV